MKLGEKIKSIRESKDWTQPQAAEAIGIEQSYLSKLENDHSVPSVEVFRRIVDAYETTVPEVMSDIDDSHFENLSQVADIADYLDAKGQIRAQRRNRHVSRLTLAMALGAGLVYGGYADLFFPMASDLGEAWKNQLVTFCGIIALTYGFIGLLVASARQQKD